jgi:hypothetical protein
MSPDAGGHGEWLANATSPTMMPLQSETEGLWPRLGILERLRSVRRMVTVILVVLLAAVVATGGAGLASLSRGQDTGPIYSVSQVTIGLASHPRQWVGRTIRVQAAVGGLDCPGRCTDRAMPTWDSLQRGDWLLQLIDADRNSVAFTSGMAPATLVVALDPRGPLVDALSRVPILDTLIPGQQVAWYGTAVYRLRLQGRPCPVSQTGCYEGVLVDAISSDPFGW